MSLIEITEASHNIILDMRYATMNNFTGKQIYDCQRCFLWPEALYHLEKAIDLAAQLGLRFKILDAYRPQYAQERLWQVCPNPDYITPPERGSNHTRGIAVDLTLITPDGQELDMGTAFDSFEPASHHGAISLSRTAAQNRYTLLGIMMSAGWDLYPTEWWHYQLFNPHQFDLISSR
ncbi:D-alanyl-D-alanine dipeptidase [Candidatus Odyssella thessalonicensis]|uniref:D-alanyl-D-alanine dipeptidase n=1 Tax=Candidatus Odyssella thessalonicensis TaxID=84647 RepID=UPI000225BB0D|nr:D-alanyl-D-alanine dipeptidase [Candidatus Odyssella thessalonicensis]